MAEITTVPFDYTAWQAANRTRTLERIAQLKPAVLAALGMHGVNQVEVTFDGCGDDGSIQDIFFHGASGPAQVILETILIGVPTEDGESADVTLDSALEDLATLALELHHQGWENNDGATGALDIDVANATFTLDCKLRYTAYHEHATEL